MKTHLRLAEDPETVVYELAITGEAQSGMARTYPLDPSQRWIVFSKVNNRRSTYTPTDCVSDAVIVIFR